MGLGKEMGWGGNGLREMVDALREGHTLLKTGVRTDTRTHRQTHKSENSISASFTPFTRRPLTYTPHQLDHSSSQYMYACMPMCSCISQLCDLAILVRPLPMSCIFSRPLITTVYSVRKLDILPPTTGRRLSLPGWLVTYCNELPARRRSPIPILTGLLLNNFVDGDQRFTCTRSESRLRCNTAG